MNTVYGKPLGEAWPLPCLPHSLGQARGPGRGSPTTDTCLLSLEEGADSWSCTQSSRDSGSRSQLHWTWPLKVLLPAGQGRTTRSVSRNEESCFKALMLHSWEAGLGSCPNLNEVQLMRESGPEYTPWAWLFLTLGWSKGCKLYSVNWSVKIAYIHR